MIIYVDVLIFLNLFINFFILQLTAKICKDGYNILRMIAAAFVGALFSLYIFLPVSTPAMEIVFKLVVSAVMILICFKLDSFKSYIRRVAVLYIASFLYAGIMIAIWSVFKPESMAINNGVVYVSISPIILLTVTVLCYYVLAGLRRLSQKHAANTGRCKIAIFAGGVKITVNALIDSGNSLCDPLSEIPVTVVERSALAKIEDALPCTQYSFMGENNTVKGFRLIPYNAIGGHGLLPAFSPEKTVIIINKKECEIKNAVIAITEEKLGEDYKAIVNPDIIPEILKTRKENV